MMIDRLSSIDPIQPGKKTGRVNQVKEIARTDSISLSKEAREKSVLHHAIDLVSVAPDSRAERIAEIKAKINDPSYINDRIISATADRIIDAFGI